MKYSKDTNYQKLLHSKKWKLLRNKYLREHPICEMCGKPATEVHHIVPLNRFRDDPIKMEQMAFDEENLMSVDHPCHEKLHIEMGKNKRTKESLEAYHKERLDNFIKNLESW